MTRFRLLTPAFVAAILVTDRVSIAHPDDFGAPGVSHAMTDVQSRIERLRRTFEARPDDDRALSSLARALLDAGRRSGDHGLLTEAEEAYADLHARRPDAPEPLVGLTHARIGRHAFGEALRAARLASRLAPQDPSVRSVLGDAHLAIGNYAEAEAIFRWRAEDLSLETLSRLALLEHELGRLDDAIITMSEARQAGVLLGEPDHVLAWCDTMRGDMFLEAGSIAEAKASYVEAVGMDPQSHHAMLGLARVMRREGREEDAARLLRRLVDQGGSARARIELVRATGDMSLLDPLRETLERDVEAGSLEHARTLVELTLEFGGDERRAAALALRELEEVRHDVDAHVVASRALARVGSHDRSLSLMRTAIGLAPGRPDVLRAGAEVFEAAGRTVEASIMRRRVAKVGGP